MSQGRGWLHSLVVTHYTTLDDGLRKERKMSGSLMKSKFILRRELYVLTYRNVIEIVITYESLFHQQWINVVILEKIKVNNC